MGKLSALENNDLIASSRIVEHPCLSCGHSHLFIFYEVRDVPVHSCLMLPTRQEALDFPCSDVILGYCPNCGFISNVEFNSKWSAYAPNYEDQQSFSPTFNKFALDLANHLVDKFSLFNKDIVEIGCSKGDFLVLLCELGNNRGVGIDPTALVGRVKSEATDRIQFIQDYYSERYSKYVGEFICCRHTLEHIYPMGEFLKTVRRSIGDRSDTIVFFEIPDMGRVLRDLAFEDIYYEHCSYFTPGALARLFHGCGFEVLDLNLAYDDQYILIEAKPTTKPVEHIHPNEESVQQVMEDISSFTARISDKLSYWRRYLDNAKKNRKKVVIWGSGSKCVAFLTTLKKENLIEYIVDINPHRHGKFIPGVGKEIMPPAFLKNYKPDQIIVMNPIYCNEIQHMLKEQGVASELIPLS